MLLVKRVLFLALLVLLTHSASGGVLTRYHNFAQVADGGAYRTTFLLFNPDEIDAQVTLWFRRDNSTPWEISIGNEVAYIFTWTIPPRGMISVSTDRLSPQVQTGWAQLTADTEVGAQAFFEVFSGDQLISQAAVESTGPVRSVGLFVEESQNSHTGIAVVSLSTAGRIRLEITLLDEQGQLVDSADILLGARQHFANFIPELLPMAGQTSGTLNIRGSGPFEVITLQLTGSVLGTLPVIKLAY